MEILRREGEKERGKDGRGERGERKEEGGGKDGEERERACSWKHLPKAASVFCVLFHSVASLRGMN